jgi:predicted ATPase
MIVTLSGFEGSGKSTLVDYLKEKEGFLVVPETARMLIPLEKTVFEESRDELSYKSFIAYLSSSHFIFENDLASKNSIVFDRNLVDSLTYLDMYSDQKIDLIKLQDYLDAFLDEKQQTSLYDEIVLIKHSKNEEHIKNNIMNDKTRLYTRSPQQYIDAAKEWEDKYEDKYNKLKNIGKTFNKIQAYPDNMEIKSHIKSVLRLSNKKVKNFNKNLSTFK